MMISVYNCLYYLVYGKIDAHHLSVTLFSVMGLLNDIKSIDQNLQLCSIKTIICLECEGKLMWIQ